MISLPDPARILIKLLGWSLRAPASWRSTSVSTTGTGFNDGLLDRMRPWMTMVMSPFLLPEISRVPKSHNRLVTGEFSRSSRRLQVVG